LSEPRLYSYLTDSPDTKNEIIVSDSGMLTNRSSSYTSFPRRWGSQFFKSKIEEPARL